MNEIEKRVNRDMGYGIRDFLRWVNVRKVDVLVTVLWSFFIALIIARAYWNTYLDNPVLIEYRIFHTSINEWIPRLQIIDYIGIFLVNIVVGFLVIDLEKVVIEWMISILLAFVFSVSWAFLFMWYTLGAGEFFPVVGLLKGMSYIIYFAILNVFRMVFPLALFCSFVSCLIGAFIGEKFRL